MRIAQRLFLSVIPGIVGLLTIAALAYWEKYAHQPPETVVIVAVVATAASLAMGWYNTRYVAKRVERLAESAAGRAVLRGSSITFRDVAHAMTGGAVSDSGRPDELDEIESTVATLSGAVIHVRDEAERREHEAKARAADYLALISEVSDRMASRLQDAELPLHVLLSSPFGSLNENQEEMLSAAQAAIGDADDEVRRLKKLINLDRGEIPVMLHAVNLQEMLRPALAIGSAHARRAGIGFASRISDASPRVLVDPVHAQEALTAVFDWAVAHGGAGTGVQVTANETHSGRISIAISHRAIPDAETTPLEMRIAHRLITIQHGTMIFAPGLVVIEFPVEGITSAR